MYCSCTGRTCKLWGVGALVYGELGGWEHTMAKINIWATAKFLVALMQHSDLRDEASFNGKCIF